MPMRPLIVMLVAAVLLTSVSGHEVKLSELDATKKDKREQAMSPWMEMGKFQIAITAALNRGEALLVVESNDKGEHRGVITKSYKARGFYFLVRVSEEDFFAYSKLRKDSSFELIYAVRNADGSLDGVWV